jgi:HlyD family secretion protein
MNANRIRKLIGLAAVLAVAVVAGGWYAWRLGRPQDESIHLSGNIEAIEVPISFKIPGHVEKRFLDEGASVKEGQPIAQLEAADLEAEVAARRGELQQAQAALDEMHHGSRPDEIAASLAAMKKAEANYEELKNGSRPQEIAASKSIYEAAKDDLERLEHDLQRAKDLRKSHPGAMSDEQYDQVLAAQRMGSDRYAEAQKRYELMKLGPRQEDIAQGKAAMEQAEAQYRLVKEGPRKEDIDQAAAKVEQAKAALKAAEVKLSYATVVSPLTGVVLSKNVEPGEYVAPGTPVVTVADVKNVWLRGYIDERDVGKKVVAWNSPAEITTDAYPGKKYRGHVGFISSEQEFTPKTVQTERERVKFVYRVKIYVDDNTDNEFELKPGMPAEARLLAPGK